MMQRAPDRPWTPERSRTCVRGRLVVRLASGAATAAVPHYRDALTQAPPLHLDRGHLDRAVRRFSPAMRVTRVYRAAYGSAPAAGAEPRWDDIEEATGLSRTFRIDLDPDVSLLAVLDALRSLAKVESASPCYLCSTPFANPPAAGPADRLYAQRMVGLEAALQFEPGDAALIVGVVDSGIDLGHPELSGRVRPGLDSVDLPPDQVSRGVRLIGDTTSADRIPRDEMGHGTACASIIGAVGRRLPRGMGGACRLLPGRALAAARVAERSALTAVGSLPDIDAAVKGLVDLGARVLNLSFGTPETALRDDDAQPHAEIIEYAHRRGCILVAASGNDGHHTRYFPAAHPHVIAVGAVGEEARPADFTTRGDHVSLCAPGEHVPGAAIGGYQTHTGTSFAAPFVTGACALLMARAARYGSPLDTATARTFLIASARPFAAGSDTRGCGAGILDVPAALRGLEQALASARQPGEPVRPLAAAAAGPGAAAQQLPQGLRHEAWPGTFNYETSAGGQVQ